MSLENQKPIFSKLWLMPNVGSLSVLLLLVTDVRRLSTKKTEFLQSCQTAPIQFVHYVFMTSSITPLSDAAQFATKKSWTSPIQKSSRPTSNYFHYFRIKISRGSRLWQWYLVTDIRIRRSNIFVNNVVRLFVQRACLMNIMDIIWCRLKRWVIRLSRI